MMKRKKIYLPLLFAIFVIVAVFSTVPAFAHNETMSYTFNDFTPYEFNNYDQAPFKGNFTLTVTNNTNSAWGNFHFYIFEIPGFDYSANGSPGLDAIFVDGNCGWASPNCDPTKTPGSLDSWSIFNNGKNIDLFYYSNPVGAGQTVTFKVYTDNTVDQQPFGVGFYPSVVPEPVSSTLFIVGAATLGVRRFRKKIAA
jgi:hypothetical protein